MRYVLFLLWASITLFLIVTAISDFIFGRHDAGRLLTRIVISLVWPLAILSAAGRDFLFNRGAIRP